jgi:hypothetical protein
LNSGTEGVAIEVSVIEDEEVIEDSKITPKIDESDGVCFKVEREADDAVSTEERTVDCTSDCFIAEESGVSDKTWLSDDEDTIRNDVVCEDVGVVSSDVVPDDDSTEDEEISETEVLAKGELNSGTEGVAIEVSVIEDEEVIEDSKITPKIDESDGVCFKVEREADDAVSTEERTVDCTSDCFIAEESGVSDKTWLSDDEDTIRNDVVCEDVGVISSDVVPDDDSTEDEEISKTEVLAKGELDSGTEGAGIYIEVSVTEDEEVIEDSEIISKIDDVVSFKVEREADDIVSTEERTVDCTSDRLAEERGFSDKKWLSDEEDATRNDVASENVGVISADVVPNDDSAIVDERSVTASTADVFETCTSTDSN